MQGQATAPNGEQLLTKLDVARRAQSSARTVSYWMERGELPFIKFGRLVRFLESDVEDFFSSRRIRGRK
jgi:excisionase family DNA binding protein